MPATRKANPESQRRAIRREYNAAREDDSFRSFFAQRGLRTPQLASTRSRTDAADTSMLLAPTSTVADHHYNPEPSHESTGTETSGNFPDVRTAVLITFQFI
jgi:hypothetical protein